MNEIVVILLLVAIPSLLIICLKLYSLNPLNIKTILKSKNDLVRHIALLIKVCKYTQFGCVEKIITLVSIVCYLLSDPVVNVIRCYCRHDDKKGIFVRDIWFLVCFFVSIVIYNLISPFYLPAYLWFIWRIAVISLSHFSTIIYSPLERDFKGVPPPVSFNRTIYLTLTSIVELSLAFGFLYVTLGLINNQYDQPCTSLSPFITALGVFTTQGISDLIFNDLSQKFLIVIQLLILIVTFLFFVANISHFFKTNNNKLRGRKRL